MRTLWARQSWRTPSGVRERYSVQSLISSHPSGGNEFLMNDK